MKKIKVVFSIFLFTCILSAMDIKADYLTISNISIPSIQGIYISDIGTKDTTSDQYVKMIGAVDKLSGDGRAIMAQIQGVPLGFVDLEEGQYVQLISTPGGLGQVPGTYHLLLKSKKWLLTEAYFTGNWVLDDNLL